MLDLFAIVKSIKLTCLYNLCFIGVSLYEKKNEKRFFSDNFLVLGTEIAYN